MSKAQTEFSNNIIYVSQETLAYYNEIRSQYAVIVLHEHLGLVPYLVNVTKQIVGNAMTIVIPDLFNNFVTGSQKISQFQLVTKLTRESVQKCVLDSIKFLHSKMKQRILLLGFSIGAAFGWSILEDIHDFEQAYLFYGLPDLQKFKPNNITCPVNMLVGSNDKVKYLSDPETVKKAMKICQNNSRIQFITIPNAGHGFLNTEAKNFMKNQMLNVKQFICNNRVSNNMNNLRTQQRASEPQQEEQSACMIF